MDEVQEIMKSYGMDGEATMRRFMGNTKLYIKLLDMLPADNSIHELDDALSAGDLEKAFEAAHTLKGVAGNLGLSPLYDAVCVIVEPLRKGEAVEGYPALFGAVQKEFKNALAMLEALKNYG